MIGECLQIHCNGTMALCYEYYSIDSILVSKFALNWKGVFACSTILVTNTLLLMSNEAIKR